MDGLVIWEQRLKNLDQDAEVEFRRIGIINNGAFQRTSAEAGLKKMRMHKHLPYLWAAAEKRGVNDEARVLLDHAIDGISQRYASTTVAGLLETDNKVQQTADKTTMLFVMNGR